MTVQPAATRSKDGHGFAADANGPLSFKSDVSRPKRRLLVVVPGEWPLDAARNLRENIERLGHNVSMLRTDDMMRGTDLEEAIPGKAAIFLYIANKAMIGRAQEVATSHGIATHIAEISYDQVVHHIQVHT